VEIAARGPRGLVSQVSVFFDNQLFQGNRVRKRSASEFGAFESPHASPLAVVGTEIRYAEPGRKPQAGPNLLPEFSRNVALFHVAPGFPARTIRERLLPGLAALVLVVFPSGTAPTHDPEFIRLLQEARKSGIPVVLAAEGHDDGIGASSGRSASGAHPSKYAAGTQLLSEGGFWAGAMTPECAYVKTAWILAQPGGARRFAALWKRDYAGEGS
jgi:L-asparaginase/Glu-tRNA(Gln) amidotransferase subunit D